MSIYLGNSTESLLTVSTHSYVICNIYVFFILKIIEHLALVGLFELQRTEMLAINVKEKRRSLFT